MDKIIKALLDLRSLNLSADDDLFDRLNRQHTTTMLLILSALVSMRQYFGETIHCWCPEQCASNHEKYANLFCWVEDTYYVPFYDKMPQMDEPRDQKITYYQWTPIILVTQAFFFFLPAAFWRVLNQRSGINIIGIIEAAVSCQGGVSSESRDKTLRYCVLLIERYLTTQRDHRRGCYTRLKHILSKHCILFYGRLYGNYLVFCYVFIKLLFVVNAVGQLFLLDVVLGYKYHLYGIQVMRHLLFGTNLHSTERFPRVTLCDFPIRQNTNVHHYTVQCVLPINIFNEKIFTLVWFWYFFISLLTFLSLTHWLSISLYWPGQLRHVKRRLKSMEAVPRDNTTLRKFVESYLRRDGLFLLTLISKNAGELVSNEILCGVWDKFNLRYKNMENSRREPRAQTRSGACVVGRPLPVPNAHSIEVV